MGVRPATAGLTPFTSDFDPRRRGGDLPHKA